MSTDTTHPERRSLRGRAALAIALTVSFYLLALGIALGLIVTPIALWVSEGAGNLWITLGMVGAGLAVLRAIVPERSGFEAPGPELERAEHPRLYAVLDEVAEATGQAPADVVYVEMVPNASVLEEGRKRVMTLGLPLLATLDTEELRAVVAHEYGHYAGGDTRFSAWIWRTRVAVLKTVSRLAQSGSWFRRNVVRWPFEGYARLFLRITNADSRQAEFAADALAARVTSAEAAGCALRRIEAVAPAFDSYWQSDVVPMLDAERRPPLATGFASMTAHAELASTLDELVRSDIETNEPDPYASHPTLRQRLEALGVPVEASAPPPAEDPAAELVDDLPELERRLLAHLFGDEVASFQPAAWSDAEAVHLDRLRGTAERFAPALHALTIGSAATVAAHPTSVREGIRGRLPEEERDAPDDAIDRYAVDIVASCVAVAAVEAGAELTGQPGEPLRVSHGSDRLEPWGLLASVAAGEIEEAEWTAHPVVEALGEAPLAASEAAPLR